MNELVSIVLPVHNQADHIEQLVAEYTAGLSRVHNPHELVLVVNNSRDDSLRVCEALAERYATIRVVHTELGGWGRAVRLGLAAASGQYLCYTNSARTTVSDLVLLVLYAIANPHAVIKAHRRSRESLRRRVGSLLYNMECRSLFDLPTLDINATPKVFSREVYEAIDLSSDGDLIDLEFYVKCKALGTVILEVPIYSKARHSGKSTTNYGSAARMYLGAYAAWRATRRNGRNGR